MAQQPPATTGSNWRRSRPALALLTLASALAFVAGNASAAPEQPWVPPPPPADGEFDWIQLPSGEWLGGELKVLYNESVEFESDQLDAQSIDWDDVEQMHTARTFIVRTVHQRTALGRVIIKDDQVTVVGAETQHFVKADVLAIASGVEREIDLWSAIAAAGANIRSGNTNQTDINLRVTARRRTVLQRIAFDYTGSFSEADDEETANNHRVNMNWDRFVSDRLYWSPLFGEYYKDPFRNIKHRATLGSGLGYQLIDNPKTEWLIAAGPAYQKTWFDEVTAGEPDTESSPAFVGETQFDHDLTDDIDLHYDYRFQLTSTDNGRYNHHMEAGISIDLVGDLNLSVTYAWDRIEVPQEDEDGVRPEKDDYQLLLNIGYEF